MSAADRAKELEKNKVRHGALCFVSHISPLGLLLTLFQGLLIYFHENAAMGAVAVYVPNLSHRWH